ncbi:hypothetical protein GF420_02045 [candidate division GN15 bacterium]|nr:hypothetical protein [candidate division GN15 bacterium]
MRFRKVRSFLSGYSNEELTDRQREAVRERLAKDPQLRAEEQAFRAMRQASKELPSMPVSGDFNTRLLNRIAEERYAETRSSAMLPPKRVPMPLWWKAVPVMVTAVLLMVVAIGTGDIAQFLSPNDATANAGSLDDTYLTAQPVDNPNLAVAVDPGWSLEREMARSQRVSQISNTLTSGSGFITIHGPMQRHQVVVRHGGTSPFVSDYYQVRPIQRVYRVSNVAEEGSVY